MDVKELVDSLRDAITPPPVVLATQRSTQSVFVPEGYTEKVINRLSLPQPQRIEQHVVTRRIADFIAYVKRYSNPASLLIVAPEVSFDGKAIVSACLDYHIQPKERQVPAIGTVVEAGTVTDAAVAAWGLHTVDYVPQISPAYALLNRFVDKLMSQDEFTQHIRNVMRFITSIEHGEMLELLRTLNLTSSGVFKSIEDPISGSVDFAYDVQVQANAGSAEKRLTIPETITFNMPILHDGDAVDIKAELRYRVPKADEGNKKVQLGIALVNKVWDEFDQLEKLGAKVASETGLLTIVGSSTNNYRSNSPKD